MVRYCEEGNLPYAGNAALEPRIVSLNDKVLRCIGVNVLKLRGYGQNISNLSTLTLSHLNTSFPFLHIPLNLMHEYRINGLFD